MEQGFNTKRFLITLSLVLLTALAVGGATYFVMNKQNNDDKALLQSQIDKLKNTDEANTTVDEEKKDETKDGLADEVTEIKRACVAGDSNVTANDNVSIVVNNDGTFAHCNTTIEGSAEGGVIFLVKTNDKWEIIHSGIARVPEGKCEEFKFPKLLSDTCKVAY